MDEVVDETDPARFDLLVFPGGVANPDQLRAKPAAVAFARSFVEAGKPAAVICHGPWTLVEADVVRGRHPTSWPSVTTDLRKAGATWRDDEVVVCACGPGPIISSRKPPDRPAFCRTMMKSRRASAADIARAPHRARAPE